MEWIVNNWSLLVALVAVVVAAVFYIRQFANKPTDEQIKAVKEWLLYAVIAAEKELGGGTGKLKLRQVYESFVTKFPWVAKVVSFELFSVWVDDALTEMRKLLESNAAIKQFVG